MQVCDQCRVKTSLDILRLTKAWTKSFRKDVVEGFKHTESKPDALKRVSTAARRSIHTEHRLEKMTISESGFCGRTEE